MSRIIGVTLLLIVLVSNFCDSNRTASNTKFHVTRVHMRECRCQVLSNGKRWCRSLRFPTNPDEKRDLIKCLCSNRNQQRFPELQDFCRPQRPGFSTPL